MLFVLYLWCIFLLQVMPHISNSQSVALCKCAYSISYSLLCNIILIDTSGSINGKVVSYMNMTLKSGCKKINLCIKRQKTFLSATKYSSEPDLGPVLCMSAAALPPVLTGLAESREPLAPAVSQIL